jgi:hypothetical protein
MSKHIEGAIRSKRLGGGVSQFIGKGCKVVFEDGSCLEVAKGAKVLGIKTSGKATKDEDKVIPTMSYLESDETVTAETFNHLLYRLEEAGVIKLEKRD